MARPLLKIITHGNFEGKVSSDYTNFLDFLARVNFLKRFN
jgi:hypothetical protein